jgi:hypothetical protein
VVRAESTEYGRSVRTCQPSHSIRRDFLILKPYPFTSTVFHFMHTDRIHLLKSKLDELLSANHVPYLNLTEKLLPIQAGVYLISANENGEYIPYYVGRASSLARRLYTNHLMGNQSTARLKKYIVESGEAPTMEDAKTFLRKNCSIQWVTEDEYRNRAALEGFFTSVLFPKYGIAPEGKRC